MKNLKSLAFGAIVALMFAACGGNDATLAKEEALQTEVFAIHDAVMPRMGEIVKLKGSLRQMQMDTTNEATIRAAISQLEKAEEDMMSWMNQFTQPEKLRETKSHEDIMAYLEGEKQRIAKVRDDMNSSIASAGRLVQSAEGQ